MGEMCGKGRYPFLFTPPSQPFWGFEVNSDNESGWNLRHIPQENVSNRSSLLGSKIIGEQPQTCSKKHPKTSYIKLPYWELVRDDLGTLGEIIGRS